MCYWQRKITILEAFILKNVFCSTLEKTLACQSFSIASFSPLQHVIFLGI